ncbi:MAG TPA: DUF1302 family protein, partial [Nevskiaceae bacterium]|nr:DUF1302 family protein [Nevskiaceae bacterium]
GATDSAVPFDSLKLQLEYPTNIQMYGFSFNTTAGDLSLQGEVAYRPRDPLQVAVVDLAFAGFGPTLGYCHLKPGTALPSYSGGGTANGCLGTTGGMGISNSATPDNPAMTAYGNSDFINPDGSAGAYKDTFDLVVGAGVGSGRSFPSFIIPYRGMQSGTNPGSDPSKPYDHNNPGYIRGWEYFRTFQFNLGGTYIMGATDNPIGADQIITLFETGATWVPDMPSLDRLQFEAPGIYTHASAGADGSGFEFVNHPGVRPGIQPDGSYQQCGGTLGACRALGGQRQACSSIDDCSYGSDGLRFNPHQADPGLFPTKISAGYDMIMLVRYESVLPGISFENRIIWKHDVYGTAPGLATNFIEGRKNADLQIEMRYKSALAFDVGYTWFWGGGSQNLNRDRDQVRTFVKYQF